MLLITFEDVPSPETVATSERLVGQISDEEQQQISQLEYELQATREDLQSTIEELESSNEELRASNEEVMSMNEDLQSTNEELETSREELQALNEELSMVNSQLEDKVQELEAANDDLSNLLSSTDIATIFLDTELCIRRFTPATRALVHLLPIDEGRPFADIAPRFTDSELSADARMVLEQLTPIEKEIHDGDDRWYIRRVAPYRTRDNRIEGVVLTFTDVTALKRSMEQLRSRERQQAAVALLGQRALLVKPGRLLEIAAEQVVDVLPVELCEVVEVAPDNDHLNLVVGAGFDTHRSRYARIEGGRFSLAGFTLEQGEPVISSDLEVEKRFTPSALLKDYKVLSCLSVIIGGDPAPRGVLGAFTKRGVEFTADDINFLQSVANILRDALERARQMKELREQTERLRLALNGGEMGTWDWDIPSDRALWDRKTYELFGLDPEKGQPSSGAALSLVHPDDFERMKAALERTFNEAVPFSEEFRVIHPDGKVRWLAGMAIPLTDHDGTVKRLIGLNMDVTDRREHQEWLEQMTDELEGQVAERTKVAEHQALQLRVLSSELIQAEQRVREKLAKALHDELQQIILASKMKLGRVARAIDDEEYQPRLEEIQELLGQAVDSTRSLAVELQPPVLKYGGLLEAMRWLARRFKKQHLLTVELESAGETLPVDEGTRLVLFETVRELLLNTVKHAGVDQVRLAISFDDDEIRLVVEDEGRGFDTGILEDFSERSPLGIGLLRIRERLFALNGEFVVSSSEGAGARFEIRAPLNGLITEQNAMMGPMNAVVRRSQQPVPVGSRLSILVVDDHKLVREGLVSLLYQYPGLEVVGEAADGETAVTEAERLSPELVIMDVGLPTMNGIEATREIKRKNPTIAVIGLSLHKERELGQAMLEAGASQLVAKDAPTELLIEAISQCCDVALHDPKGP